MLMKDLHDLEKKKTFGFQGTSRVLDNNLVLEKSFIWCYHSDMITQQTQVKLNLPNPLKEYLESKAGRFGLPLASYLRYLILKDVDGLEFPVYPASERTIKKARKALEDIKRSVLVKDIDKFFKKL